MRSERLDGIRRELLSDLAARLDQAALDADTRERIEAELRELQDRVLMRLDGFGYEREARAMSATAEFALVGMWPLVLARVAPLLVADVEDQKRLALAFGARLPQGGGDGERATTLRSPAQTALSFARVDRECASPTSLVPFAVDMAFR